MGVSLLFNDQWSFSKNGSKPELINVPHTPEIEDLNVYKPFQGICTYEKSLFAKSEWQNQRVAIKFDGVMQNCRLFINGNLAFEHFGGYLPFTVDIDKYLIMESDNRITLEVDNRDDKSTPPGKPTGGLDFLYFGGIYRDVNLIITPKLYVTDAIQFGVPRAGGIYAEIKSLCENEATLFIRVTLANDTEKPCDYQVKAEILDGEKIACVFEEKGKAKCGGNYIEKEVRVSNPKIWDLGNPFLYQIRCTVLSSQGTHIVKENYGIRTAAVDENGFLLNGKPIRLYGVNRHQQFPYIGLAASENAQRREARLLKSMGINTVRLSHYPQSEHFIDECDKIGLLLIEPVPGWQFCNGGIFRKRLLQNIHDMLRRDRNHASVVVYEVTPNETPIYCKGASDKFYKKLNAAAKEELNNVLTSGDSAGRRNPEKIGYDIPHTGESKKKSKRLPYDGKKKFLTREYGDWGFGGNHSSSRVSREDGEDAMRVQAWNFQWNTNDNYLHHNILGDLVWEGIDHNRGYFKEEPISKSGVLDIFRIPKFSFYFYQSQQNNFPVLFPAIWNVDGAKKIPVFSNCHKIELFVNGIKVKEQLCDNGASAEFDEKNFKKTNDNYWMTKENHITVSTDISDLGRFALSCMYDGGNCEKLFNPPFTFDNLALTSDDTISFVGYDEQGRECAKKVMMQYSAPKKLKIEICDLGLPLQNKGKDFVFVYVHLLDNDDNDVYASDNHVSLSVDNGTAIGHHTIENKGGISPFMVMANEGVQSITITAKSKFLDDDSLTVNFSM